MSNPECIEESPNVGQCWDCPERTGASRIFGRLAMKIWKSADWAGVERTRRQRGDCAGFVPERTSTYDTNKKFVREGDRVLVVASHFEIYRRACSRVREADPEIPDEIRRTMANNDIERYVVETDYRRDWGDADEMAARLAGFHATIDEIIDANTEQA